MTVLGNIKLVEIKRCRLKRCIGLDGCLSKLCIVTEFERSGNVENVGGKRAVLARAVRDIERLGRERAFIREIANSQSTRCGHLTVLGNIKLVEIKRCRIERGSILDGSLTNFSLVAKCKGTGNIENVGLQCSVLARTVRHVERGSCKRAGINQSTVHIDHAASSIDRTYIRQVANRERRLFPLQGNRTIGNGEVLGRRLKIIEIQRRSLFCRAGYIYVVKLDTCDRRRTVHAGRDIDRTCNRELIGSTGQVLIPKCLQIDRQIARNVNVAVCSMRIDIK